MIKTMIPIKTSRKAAKDVIRGMEANGYVAKPTETDYATEIHFEFNGRASANYYVTLTKKGSCWVGFRPDSDPDMVEASVKSFFGPKQDQSTPKP
jgi:hypothetical protein